MRTLAIGGEISLSAAALDRLMPLHLRLSPTGIIAGVGPTLAKLVPPDGLLGRGVFEVFTFKRPSGILTMADLMARNGQRLHLKLRADPASPGFRGLALAGATGDGALINLSFGIGVIDAVRKFALTDSDFSPTDLTVEMLYLAEAKAVVMDALKDLNRRLNGARVEAEQQALTDTLTGLKNRRALELTLAALTQAKTSFGLMHIDLDFFKAVNDTLGHAAGDHVLRCVAKVLARESRNSDTVARAGGDEFVIVFPGMTHSGVLAQIARNIIDGLTQPMEFEGQPCRVSASIGITLSTRYDPPDIERMSGDADEALYASKRAGRGRALFF